MQFECCGCRSSWSAGWRRGGRLRGRRGFARRKDILSADENDLRRYRLATIYVAFGVAGDFLEAGPEVSSTTLDEVRRRSCKLEALAKEGAWLMFVVAWWSLAHAQSRDSDERRIPVNEDARERLHSGQLLGSRSSCMTPRAASHWPADDLRDPLSLSWEEYPVTEHTCARWKKTSPSLRLYRTSPI